MRLFLAFLFGFNDCGLDTVLQVLVTGYWLPFVGLIGWRTWVLDLEDSTKQASADNLCVLAVFCPKRLT